MARKPDPKKKTTGGKGSQPPTPAPRPTLLSRVGRLFRKPLPPPPPKARRTAAPAPAPEPPKPAPGLLSRLSLDRRLDILGIILSLVGLFTLLSLFSVNHSGPTGSWLALWERVFGWGVYLFPLGLISLGLWLVLRNFERVPQVAPERITGVCLLYTGLLVILHAINTPATATESLALATRGAGGGYVGSFLWVFLKTNLGWGGTAIAMLAWLLIGLALTLDVSVLDLFRWVTPLITRLQDWWDERSLERNGRLPGPAAQAASLPTPAAGAPTAGRAIPMPPLHRPSPASAEPAPHVWVLPQVDEILEPGSDNDFDDEIDRHRAHVIEETLASFGAPVNVVEINRGPTITQFGVEPDFVETRTGRVKVRVGKISALADDLALALSARTIRVQAPVPGKGFVGIEVPNDEIALVALRDTLESEAFKRLKSPLRFALGQDVAGNAIAADLAVMPHLLIAGATGSGKSVCVNALISSLLLYNTPDDLRLIMVDPKRVELTGYNGIPHLLAPVVTEMERVTGALQWVLREMDQRYHKLAQAGARNITEYNAKCAARNEKPFPRLVMFIDELADLMLLAPEETERSLTRLAQLARATGIHLVIATQRPSVDVVTGIIKANFPARVAFAVASGVDSRVILDQPGAERLLGRGDMLFQAPDSPAPVRLQGAFVSDAEIQDLVSFWRAQAGAAASAAIALGTPVDALPAGVPLKQMPLWDDMAEEDGDPLVSEAIDLVRTQGRASITMLQRRFRIGYTRAARLVETLQEKGIIGTEAGPQGFPILDYGPAAPPIDE
jgi:S-DNA-T family DNA segregation ATPase FtsK/SpoIIIE